MRGGLHMLGAKDASAKPESKDDSWASVAATLAGGAVGAFLWKKHPVLGLLNGFALAGNATRMAMGNIPVRRGVENLGAHLVATAGSLALPSHPMIGYLAGAAGSNLFLRRKDTYLERLDETVLGRAKKLIGVEGGDPAEYGPLSPAQLAALDRALTPAEQKAVDEAQSGEATTLQAKEEAKPFVNPLTGKLTKLSTTYTPGVATPTAARPWWQWALAALGIVVAGGALYVGVSGDKAKVI